MARSLTQRAKRKTYSPPFKYDENGDLELIQGKDYLTPPVSSRVLLDRHQAFINHYLTHWDRRAAALVAGYGEEFAYEQGSHLLSKPSIRAEIQRRMDELVMSADEALVRLSKQARGSMADFIELTPSGPVFNFEKAEALGSMGLIKELKTKTKVANVIPGKRKAGDAPGEEETVVVEVMEIDFKLYDAQAALKLIGQAHNVFADRKEQTGTVRLVIEYGNTGDGSLSDDPQRPAGSVGNGINTRKQIPIIGYNPMDLDDEDDDDDGRGDGIPLDPRHSGYHDPVVDVDDYDVDTDNFDDTDTE
jgi:hypothetical protein